MPVAEFPGRFGWGYDGVDLFAPTHLYGTPDDFRRFVDAAHAVGLGVILDVVYNHLGPDGSYLRQFSPDYFTDRHANEWGDALNFDGAGSAPVREFFIANADYWIDEFHLDGLRLDATQQIFDDSPEHVLAAIARAARAAARGRRTLMVAENEPQDTRLVLDPPTRAATVSTRSGTTTSITAAVVALTGRREAYYTDYLGSAPGADLRRQARASCTRASATAGRTSAGARRPQAVPPTAFVDLPAEPRPGGQLGPRRAAACRLTAPGCWRALTALLLLGPATPMLFQGQEFAASSPFLYFADHHGALADQVRKGRAEFLAQFPSIATAEVDAAGSS